MHATLRRTLDLLTLGALAALAGTAHAQTDRTVYENALERSAANCPGYSTERAGPGIRAVPVGALRVVARREFTLCPDRRLDAATPVVWYGERGVFTWNPDVPAGIEVLKSRVDAMTRTEDFPADTVVWDSTGKPVSGATVPSFEFGPRPRL